MKVRNGFVSNSSSSSFVILKEAISNEEIDMILNYQKWIEFFIKLDEGNENSTLAEDFEYYLSDPWRIVEYEDFIFGETSMDNLDMPNYFDYIKLDQKYIDWDDGYNEEPYQTQIKFIENLKREFRKKKINKLNKLN